MDIEYWDNGNRGGMGGMMAEWQKENGSPEGTFNLFCEILEENNII